MSDNSDNKEQTNGQENTDNIQPCSCGGGCCSSGSGGQSKCWRMVVFILIVIAAGVVLAHSFLKKSNSDARQPQQTFPSVQVESKNDVPSVNNAGKQDTSAKVAPALWRADLGSLASLDKAAADTDAVFVFLAAEDQQSNQNIISQIETAAKTIQANGVRISAFKLNKTAPDYAQLAKQFPVPSVLAMVKGRGMNAVSGQISETKLVQAYVTASRPASGCCPGGAGSSTCAPSTSAPLGPRR